VESQRMQQRADRKKAEKALEKKYISDAVDPFAEEDDEESLSLQTRHKKKRKIIGDDD
jgi:enolase